MSPPPVDDAALFRAAFERAEDAAVIHDDHHLPVRVNDAACKLFGLPREQLLGRALVDLRRGEERAWSTLVERGHEATHLLLRSDGSSRLVEGVTMPNIAPGLHLTTFRDITERTDGTHRTDARMHVREEARFRALIEGSAEGIALLDENGAVRYISAAVETLLGHAPAVFLGAPCSDHLAEAEALEMARVLARLRADPSQPVVTELRTRHADGSVRWIEITANNRLADPTVGAIVSNFRDVTERHRAAAALRESQERYLEVVERTPKPLVIHIAGRITYVNTAAARLFDADARELIGLLLADLVTETAPDGAPAAAPASEGEVVTMQRFVHRRTGDVSHLEVTSVPFRFDGPDAVLSFYRDVTPVVLAEQLAAAAGERADAEHRTLEATLEALPVGVWLSDPNGRLFRKNAAADRIWRGDAPLSASLDEYAEYVAYWPHTGIRLRNDEWALARTLATGETIVAEPLDLERFDGTRGHVLNSTSVIRDRSGAIVGGVVVMLDDSERRAAAHDRERLLATLDFERANLGRLLETAPAMIAVLRGPDHTVELANEDFRKLAGPRALLGRPLREALPELVNQGVSARVDAAFCRGETFRAAAVPLVLGASSGPDSTRFVNLLYQPILEENGERSGVFVHGVDVTEETLARRRIDALFRALPIPAYVWRHDTEPGGDFVLTEANTAAIALSGPRVAEQLGHRASALFGPLVVDDLHRCLESETGFVVERELTTPQGVRQVRVTYALAGPQLVVTHVEDITERRRLEEQYRQAQKMEAVGRLAGGVAHDFNNVLSVILSYTEMYLEELQPSDPLHADLTEVHNAGERAVGITRQLLAFSRKQILQPRALDLNATLKSLGTMLHRLIGEDIELRLRFAPDLPLVFVDAGQIEQVIMNLVLNARDAMPTGGKLTIETAATILDEQFAAEHLGVKPGPHVMLAVSDTGIGMDATTRSQIFEPFFTTKPVGKGTGLGLSTAFGIIHQSGGSIWVYSEPGEGTVFKVYLPRAHTSASDRAPVVRSARGGTETILVVEDEEAVRKLACTMLRRAGYRVFEAANGGEALLLAEQHAEPIHLMLTDVIMPRMSGRILVERIGPTRPDMKVIYMSGYTDDAIIHHGVMESGTPFVQKPLTVENVLSTVRSVLDR